MSLYWKQGLIRMLPTPACHTTQRAQMGRALHHTGRVPPSYQHAPPSLQHAISPHQHAPLHTSHVKEDEGELSERRKEGEPSERKRRVLDLYQREFIDLVKSRIDRRRINRTMSLKDRNNPNNKRNDDNVPDADQPRGYKVDMPSVDCVVGVLSRSSIKPAEKTLGSECGGYQGQRQMAKNEDRKFKKLAAAEFYEEKFKEPAAADEEKDSVEKDTVPRKPVKPNKVPIQCQYTKELELRRYRGDDRQIKFPIDNESIVWEESHVPFTEHIFLHKYISLFPPETHRFMETIVSALQNNPDLTVEKKKHIIWSYLNYFNFNKELLQEDEEEVLEV